MVEGRYGTFRVLLVWELQCDGGGTVEMDEASRTSWSSPSDTWYNTDAKGGMADRDWLIHLGFGGVEDMVERRYGEGSRRGNFKVLFVWELRDV